MKYFSTETVVNAYKGFQDCMTNKSWGYLSLLKGCKNKIYPSVPYEVDLDVVSNFLEDIFNLSQTKKEYEGGRSLYVVFSNKWEHYFNDQGKYSPNIYDVIVWAYRRKSFSDDVTKEDILNLFSIEFNIPSDVITKSFDLQHRNLAFSNSLYYESQLKIELGRIGVDTTKNNIDAKKSSVVASPGEISRGPFIQTLYAGLEIADYVIIMQSEYLSLYGKNIGTTESSSNSKKILSLQQIFYGAPGTGKSNTIKRYTDIAEEDGRVIRTTFHPDSDYSTFVGAYKPTMKESRITKDGVTITEEKIVYAFCPQAFTNAYVKAWRTTEDVYLVIEEINRGNCAQIFGDLFQLLDRKGGVSEYPVEADTDLRNYLQKELATTNREDVPEKVKSGEKLMLPKNLYIWATMNTSDQSLFPIDSAFKRRWEWKYMKIKNHPEENYRIKIGEGEQDWWEFIKKINEIIASMTSSADKQLGYFFCTAKDGVIDEETFVSKVIFYLWNDVFKDYGFEDASLFRYEDEKGVKHDLTFPDFYDEDGEKVNTDRLAEFVKNVMDWKKENAEND